MKEDNVVVLSFYLIGDNFIILNFYLRVDNIVVLKWFLSESRKHGRTKILSEKLDNIV